MQNILGSITWDEQMSHVARSLCLSVCWAHGWAVQNIMAEPIEMPFGGWGLTHLSPRNYGVTLESRSD